MWSLEDMGSLLLLVEGRRPLSSSTWLPRPWVLLCDICVCTRGKAGLVGGGEVTEGKPTSVEEPTGDFLYNPTAGASPASEAAWVPLRSPYRFCPLSRVAWVFSLVTSALCPAGPCFPEAWDVLCG